MGQSKAIVCAVGRYAEDNSIKRREKGIQARVAAWCRLSEPKQSRGDIYMEDGSLDQRLHNGLPSNTLRIIRIEFLTVRQELQI